MDEKSLQNRLISFGQEKMGNYLGSISGEKKDKLVKQLQEIDFSELKELVELHIVEESSNEVDYDSLQPAPFIALPENGGDPRAWENARVTGEEAIRKGRVAAFTVAGGQGTRLGFSGPKGTFAVTPVRKASLFQVFAEKLLCARHQYDVSIPWIIMTSRINHEDTVQFFQRKDFFGIPKEDVVFFSQGMMPAVDFDGNLILEDSDKIAVSPDGHGGCLRALVRNGITDWMKSRGIDILSYFQVDNPLLTPVDPAFIGFHVQKESQMSSKMIPKACPEEKVGLFTISENVLRVIEYSDLPSSLANEKNDDGSLRFNAGSIAIHVFDLAFIEKMGAGKGEMPFHRANKKIPIYQADGSILKPAKPNGIKFEMFVFDALPLAKNPIVIETDRSEEFSPVKNAEGVDSPITCQQDLLRQYVRWLNGVGLEVPVTKGGLPENLFEISPLRGFDRTSFINNKENKAIALPEADTVIN